MRSGFRVFAKPKFFLRTAAVYTVTATGSLAAVIIVIFIRVTQARLKRPCYGSSSSYSSGGGSSNSGDSSSGEDDGHGWLPPCDDDEGADDCSGASANQ